MDLATANLGLVRRHPVWRNASDSGVRALLKLGELRSVASGAMLIRAGEPAKQLHLLLDGAVRVYYPPTRDRGELTVKLFGAPAIFGDAECVQRGNWNESVKALVASQLLIVDAAPYFQLLQREPTVCFAHYWEVARQFAVAIAYERTTASITERVIAVLVAYASQFGRPDGDGVLIDRPLTQERLAQQTGSTRRTLVRVLAELYEAKLLQRVGRRYRVAPIETLLHRAGALLPNIAVTADPAPWARITEAGLKR